MRRALALILLLGLSVSIAKADDKPTDFSTIAPENDSRLAKLTDAPRRRLGF